MKILLMVLCCWSVVGLADRKPLTEPQPYQQRQQKPVEVKQSGNLQCVIKPVMTDLEIKACQR
ncbi:MAG: hypothetical protein LUP96_05195 [Methylococcaceae bacterium]|nr:hypothetical protein [Methylococcaceae bacterium]